MEERVLTKDAVNQYNLENFDLSSSNNTHRENYSQAVCTGIDGEIIYITAHIFFEDLAKIQQTQIDFNKNFD